MAKKILVIHGPNLNLLGKREPDIYGSLTLEDVNESLNELAKQLNVGIEIVQTNSEGEIVDLIQGAKERFDALVLNAGGYTHSSVAIRDAIAGTGVKVVEVHISNIYSREEFRQRSLISPVSVGQVAGFGADSYLLGLRAAANIK